MDNISKVVGDVVVWVFITWIVVALLRVWRDDDEQ